MALSRPFKEDRLASSHASLLQAIDGVMSLALCPQVVSQASQHFRSSEKQATCEGCFARHSLSAFVSVQLDAQGGKRRDNASLCHRTCERHSQCSGRMFGSSAALPAVAKLTGNPVT